MSGSQIGIDVSAAKSINGLLGIADKHQVTRVWLRCDGLEKGVLLIVGVLKLVDEHDWILLGEVAG